MLFLGGGHRVLAAANDPVAPPPTSVASGHGALSPREAELLRKYDTNHDGRLDEAELAAAHVELMEVQEQTGGVPAQRLYLRLVQLFDRNGDGRLDAAQQTGALEYLHEHNPAVYQRLLTRFDANEDGTIDPAESARLFAALERLAAGRPRVPGGPAAALPTGKKLAEK